jgi:hypothetical protein
MQCPSRMPPVGTIPCQVFTYAKSLPLPHGTCGLAHALRFGHFLLSLPCAPCKWPRLPDPPGLQVPAMLELQVVPTLNMDTSTYIRCVVPGAAHLRCPSVVLHGRALSARRDFLLGLDGPTPYGEHAGHAGLARCALDAWVQSARCLRCRSFW